MERTLVANEDFQTKIAKYSQTSKIVFFRKTFFLIKKLIPQS